MNHSQSEIIRQYLIDMAVGSVPEAATDWPIYYGAMPDRPNIAICVYNTQGRHDGRLLRTGEVIEHPGFMVKVRGIQDNTVFAKASYIAKEILDKIHNAPVVIEGSSYTINAVSRPVPIIPLGQEEGNQRLAYTINAFLTVKEN